MKYMVICQETSERMNDKPLDIFKAEEMVLKLRANAERCHISNGETYVIMPYNENHICK